MDATSQRSMLGNYLLERRETLALRPAKVAQRLGVTAQTYGKLESGFMVPSESQLQCLIDILDLDKNILLRIHQLSAVCFVEELYRDSDDEVNLAQHES